MTWGSNCRRDGIHADFPDPLAPVTKKIMTLSLRTKKDLRIWGHLDIMTSGKVSCLPGPSRVSIPAARAASCTVPGTDLPRTRRSAMPQSRTRDLGIDGHTESMAVAYVTHEHGAAVTSLGTLGTRQGDRALRLRTRPSQAQALSWVSAAGPWGAWRSRDLTTPGPAGWVVAPSRMP